MALTDEMGSNMYMPVAPAYTGNCGNSGFGFGDSGWWIILLFILLGNNGWGNGFGGGIGNDIYPWMNQSNQVNDGFRDQMINSTVNGIQSAVTSGFGDVQTALCGGFAGVNASINGAQNTLAQQMYTNQIADLERSFNAQTANTAGLTNLSAQLANCCCENRQATNDVKYTIATEACANRATSTANTQAILDKLCQLELDTYKTQLEAKNDTINQLRADLSYARGQASQDVQTAQIIAGQTAEVDALYNRLNNCPVPTTPVYGRTPIFTCSGNGCGCNGNF